MRFVQVTTGKCRFLAKNGFCDWGGARADSWQRAVFCNFSHKDTLILKCKLQTPPPWSCSWSGSSTIVLPLVFYSCAQGARCCKVQHRIVVLCSQKAFVRKPLFLTSLVCFFSPPLRNLQENEKIGSRPHIFFFPFFSPLPWLPPISKKIRRFLTEMWASLLLDGNYGNNVCSTVQ